MKNLINTLSADLQKKLLNYKVYSITIEENEVNVFSEYDLHFSFIEAIENELLGKN
jgi:hypothetical protein